jgi:hypothetical protein
MPWHLSKSDPRKVYDSYHNMVCVCQNAEQAKLIVDAVREFQPHTELAFPAVPDATADHPAILKPDLNQLAAQINDGSHPNDLKDSAFAVAGRRR